MVSPPNKNGADVASDTRRTRAAADGSAIGFISLGSFGDAIGTAVATDYIAQRSTATAPGDNGWATHAITPQGSSTSFQQLLSALEPLYVGEFSADLDSGLFYSANPITGEPNVEKAVNLYRRDDLRTPGVGSYDLATTCPLCESTSTPLSPAPTAGALAPMLAGASADFSRIIFESARPLTSDTPVVADRTQLFEWANGALSLVGRIPVAAANECDDGGSSPCAPAEMSVAGLGAGSTNGVTHALSLTPHAISDGSDGHNRIFFTTPTDETGTVTDPYSYDGNVYMRLDGTRTIKLNVSESTSAGTYARARFLDASADGTRAFFSTTEQLTENAPAAGNKLYAYDTTKPASAPDNLTLLNPEGEPADQDNFRGFIGSSDDGSYVYMVVGGQIVSGQPVINGKSGIYAWHDGAVTYIGNIPNQAGTLAELRSAGDNYLLIQRQARVTPDGRHMLFSATNGVGLTGYDHGPCAVLAAGCRELYVYSADDKNLQCASCNPSGAAATVMVETIIRKLYGGTQSSWHQTHTLSDDGRHVFFSTGERLVGEDRNGISDAYVYDTVAGKPYLLSSGEDAAPSYFLDASADGRDAFFSTRQRLSAWDVDGAYDIYDARVDGGFPEPLPPPPSCQGDACQPAPVTLNDPTPGSSSISGPGDESTRKARARCGKGQRKVKARGGKSRCVKSEAKKHTKQKQKRANGNRRTGK